MKFTTTLLILMFLIVTSKKVEATTDTWRANDNGTVTDVATAFEWQQEPHNIDLNHAQAISYCQELSLAGKNDWRLPQIKELTSIVDYRKFSRAQDRDFGVASLNSYWSATSQSNDSSKAWQVDFLLGQSNIPTNKTELASVRCVRN